MTNLSLKMKREKSIETSLIWLIALMTILFVSADLQSINAQENQRFFTFKPITEVEFRRALKNNYNAPFETKIADSTKLEKAFESIEKTYDDEEKELAKSELCKSPRCLTSFEAYYQTLNLYLFFILDYHYEKACFVFSNTNEMASGYYRFRGSYGVMSNDGLWVGLERKDCDNALQMEICKTSKLGVWSLFRFDFYSMDINEAEKTAIFWADKNTIYIASHEYEQLNENDSFKFYAIKFEY